MNAAFERVYCWLFHDSHLVADHVHGWVRCCHSARLCPNYRGGEIAPRPVYVGRMAPGQRAAGQEGKRG